MRQDVHALTASNPDRRDCACGEGTAFRSVVVQEFPYGSGDDAVMLRATVPVWTCGTCEDEYVDAEGEAAQHAAVCRHLDRATPAEVKAVRVAARMSQKEFADALPAGVASVKRWEAGTVMPNRSATEAIRRLRAARRDAATPPVFQTPTPPAARAAAARFSLRGWHPGRHAEAI